jgi:hypothetical protein
MHIIANAYHFRAMVCNCIGIGMQWYNIGMVLVLLLVWYAFAGIDIIYYL